MGGWITGTLSSMGYIGVVWLTFLENVFPPIPSELIMPLAGYLVAQGRMTMIGAVLAGTAGSILGALLLYYVGRWYGEDRLKRFADRHGRWLTLSSRDIDRASKWFAERGTWAVFVCRLIPGLRSLISIPAGIHCMGLGKFLAATALGTLLWTGLLVYLGNLLGENFERVGQYIDPVTKVVLGGMLLVYLWRVIRGTGHLD
ncbi:DedA family protein [Lysobacter korlensis]|uniref:DedA family protein n=1 Tax=Lysobacter korlensis TaxID=553636 RepID=A0ABV6RK30_9GAMM